MPNPSTGPVVGRDHVYSLLGALVLRVVPTWLSPTAPARVPSGVSTFAPAPFFNSCYCRNTKDVAGAAEEGEGEEEEEEASVSGGGADTVRNLRCARRPLTTADSIMWMGPATFCSPTR